jgi:hypothetical protein
MLLLWVPRINSSQLTVFGNQHSDRKSRFAAVEDDTGAKNPLKNYSQAAHFLVI